MEDITGIIDELKEEFEKGKSSLWGKKANMEKCEELIEELRHVLPSAVQEANYVLSQRDKILAQAKETADKTVREAEVRAEQLLSEGELVKKSESEADEIVLSAQKRVDQLYSITVSNIDKLLKSVEDYLLQNLHIVRANREELNNGSILRNFTNKNKKN